MTGEWAASTILAANVIVANLVLLNRPLVTPAMHRFLQTLGTSLTKAQADALTLALEQAQGQRFSLTDIRSLGISTKQESKQIADQLIQLQLLESSSDTQFHVPQQLRHGLAAMVKTMTEQVTGEVTGEVRRLLAVMTGDMKRADIQKALGLKHEDHFRDAYLLPALAAGVIEMTQPDKPRSSKQRYRCTSLGLATHADASS